MSSLFVEKNEFSLLQKNKEDSQAMSAISSKKIRLHLTSAVALIFCDSVIFR